MKDRAARPEQACSRYLPEMNKLTERQRLPAEQSMLTIKYPQERGRCPLKGMRDICNGTNFCPRNEPADVLWTILLE